jgi:hypothetical protein
MIQPQKVGAFWRVHAAAEEPSAPGTCAGPSAARSDLGALTEVVDEWEGSRSSGARGSVGVEGEADLREEL